MFKSPPSKKGRSGPSFYLLNESIRIMSAEKNHRQPSPGTVCLYVCVCYIPSSLCRAWEILRRRKALVGYEHAQLGDKDVIWGLKSKILSSFSIYIY